ncbi:B12-binding domain-containing radical SAM protein [Saccharicrinis sp. FJH62]|uniref:B12-binding domain-containing radical SAM protein n=1 Tax=Saccharicrinis sp. FJH62 TaxID=3344657 RepID=UPI0035D45920
MKITLIYPYYTEKIRSTNRVEFPPLGLLYIASVIESMGHQINVIPIENINIDLNTFETVDIIGYGITSSVTYPLFREINDKLRDKAEFFISGNCHTNFFPEMVLNELNLDKVFVGESENTLYKFIKNPNHKKEKIIGDKVDLDSIPMPARHLLPDSLIYLNSRVGGKLNNVISMVSSRGCLNDCTFCAIYNKKSIRYRSPENFENEIIQLKTYYPKVTGIVLLDENFTISNEHVLNISKILKKHNLPFECNSRVDTLNEENIKTLTNNECAEVRIGLESGSTQLLKKMNKRMTLSQVEQVLKLCKTKGLAVKLYLMHGFPGENMQTTNETIKFIEQNKKSINRIALYRFSPLPGSKIFNSSKINKRSWEDYTIYMNDLHWYGSEEDYNELNLSYSKLSEYLNQTFYK